MTKAATLRSMIAGMHLSVSSAADLLGMRPDYLRHLVAGSKPIAEHVWDDLGEIDAGITEGAIAARRAGEAVVPAGNVIAAAIAARAQVLAALDGDPPVPIVDVAPMEDL